MLRMVDQLQPHTSATLGSLKRRYVMATRDHGLAREAADVEGNEMRPVAVVLSLRDTPEPRGLAQGYAQALANKFAPKQTQIEQHPAVECARVERMVMSHG